MPPTRFFHRIVDPGLLIRRLNITANHVMSEREVPEADACEQMDLFVDYEIMQEEKRREEAEQVREKKDSEHRAGYQEEIR